MLCFSYNRKSSIFKELVIENHKFSCSYEQNLLGETSKDMAPQDLTIELGLSPHIKQEGLDRNQNTICEFPENAERWRMRCGASWKTSWRRCNSIWVMESLKMSP